MKIGLATPSWNSERWIYPFLKLTEGVDRRVIVQGLKPLDYHVTEYGVSKEPDRSEKMIRKFFPDVEIIYQDTNKFGPDFWNKGHNYLASDCDFILRFDTDEMIEPKYWKELLKTIRTQDMNALGIDFGKAIMYDRNLDSGVLNENKEWIETRGMKAEFQYQNFGEYIGDKFIPDWPIGALHHYKGIKGQVEKKGDYETPKWLSDLFKEGWDKLETL